jgi:NADH-quinone oxidoreductase subunit C
MFQDAERIKERFGDAFLGYEDFRGQPTVTVRPDRAFEILRFLRDDADLNYRMLVDVTAVDYEGKDDRGRFCVVYHLVDMSSGKRIRIKAFLPETRPQIDSVAPLWRAADWGEREVYDLMGITFLGHPDLRRILLPESFEDHPLRKEYPVRGRGERDAFIKYDPEDGI